MKELSPKQLRFAQTFVRLGNATEAARQAGYKGNVDVQAQRLLANARVRALIDEAKRDMAALFAAEAYDSVQTIRRLRDDPTSPAQVRLQAARDLLDRAGLKPVDRVEHGGRMGLDHGVETSSANALLAALGYDPLGTTEPGDAGDSDSGDPAPAADPGGG